MNVHGVEDTGGTGQRGTDGKGERNHRIAVHSHQGGGVSVLGKGAKGETEPRVKDNLAERDQKNQRNGDHQQMVTGDGHSLTEGYPDGRQQIRKRLLIHPEKDLPPVG